MRNKRIPLATLVLFGGFFIVKSASGGRVSVWVGFLQNKRISFSLSRKDTGTEPETLPERLSVLNSCDFFLILAERIPPLPKKHRDVPPRKSIGTVGRKDTGTLPGRSWSFDQACGGS